MDRDELEARLLAVEALVAKVAKSTQEPVLDLLDWLGQEQVHDLGRTRGELLALRAAVRALVAVAGRERLVPELELALAQAEADALMLGLPERSMAAAQEGLSETAAALRREVAAPRGV